MLTYIVKKLFYLMILMILTLMLDADLRTLVLAENKHINQRMHKSKTTDSQMPLFVSWF